MIRLPKPRLPKIALPKPRLPKASMDQISGPPIPNFQGGWALYALGRMAHYYNDVATDSEGTMSWSICKRSVASSMHGNPFGAMLEPGTFKRCRLCERRTVKVEER